MKWKAKWNDNHKVRPKESGLYLVLDYCYDGDGRTMETLWYDHDKNVWNRCAQPIMWTYLPDKPPKQ